MAPTYGAGEELPGRAYYQPAAQERQGRPG